MSILARILLRPSSWATTVRRNTLCSAAAAATPASPPSKASERKEMPASKARQRKETAAAVTEGEIKDYKPLYRRLSALGSSPEGSVTKTLNKWLMEGRSVFAVELMKYVKELRKYKRYSQALELMDWMVTTRGMNMSHHNHAIRLDLISKVKGIDSAEEYFFSLPEPAKNQQTYGALLNCYCSWMLEDKAVSLFEKMKELNLSSSTLVHTNLMSLYMKLGQPERVPAQFQQMKSQNIALDNFTCCIVMNSYASLKDIDSVDRVIREIEEGGKVALQWSAYSTLASIYISAGLTEKAKSALGKLEGLMDTRDREPFHYLITLNTAMGNLEEVRRVWRSLKTTLKKPTNMSYLTILQSLSKLDDLVGMLVCFNEWDSVYERFDPRLVNVMAGANLRHGRVGEAESIWKKALGKGFRFDLRTLDMFLDYYLKNRDADNALRWIESATSILKLDNWKLSKENVEAFIECFEGSENVEEAEKLCKWLKKLGCLDLELYESHLKTYSVREREGERERERVCN